MISVSVAPRPQTDLEVETRKQLSPWRRLVLWGELGKSPLTNARESHIAEWIYSFRASDCDFAFWINLRVHNHPTATNDIQRMGKRSTAFEARRIEVSRLKKRQDEQIGKDA